jgi:hypothetical protein
MSARARAGRIDGAVDALVLKRGEERLGHDGWSTRPPAPTAAAGSPLHTQGHLRGVRAAGAQIFAYFILGATMTHDDVASRCCAARTRVQQELNFEPMPDRCRRRILLEFHDMGRFAESWRRSVAPRPWLA